MVDADIYAAYVPEKGKPWVVSDLFATAHKKPLNDTLQGGQDNILNPSLSLSTKGVVVFQFTRKLDTGDKVTDWIINPTGPTTLFDFRSFFFSFLFFRFFFFFCSFFIPFFSYLFLFVFQRVWAYGCSEVFAHHCDRGVTQITFKDNDSGISQKGKKILV